MFKNLKNATVIPCEDSSKQGLGNASSLMKPLYDILVKHAHNDVVILDTRHKQKLMTALNVSDIKLQFLLEELCTGGKMNKFSNSKFDLSPW